MEIEMNKQAIITACGVSKKVTDKGTEIYAGRKKLYTLVPLDNAVRTVYPRGGEYTHSTHWNVKLTPSYIEDAMFRVAFGMIQDEIYK
jgi:hypothetical protein